METLYLLVDPPRFISIHLLAHFHSCAIYSFRFISFIMHLPDLRIIEGSIDVDQSPLTGESLLVAKNEEDGRNEVPFQ